MKKFFWLIRWTAFLTCFVGLVYYAPRWVTCALVMMGILAWEIARTEEQAERAQWERDQAEGDPHVSGDPRAN